MTRPKTNAEFEVTHSARQELPAMKLAPAEQNRLNGRMIIILTFPDIENRYQ